MSKSARRQGTISRRYLSVAAVLLGLCASSTSYVTGRWAQPKASKVARAAEVETAAATRTLPVMPPSIAAGAAAAGTAAARRAVRLQLLAAVAATCRGQCSESPAKDGALQLVQAMEALNPTVDPGRQPGLLAGEWRLIFASEDVTRSSPFFWGWRQLLKGVPDPNPISRNLLGTEALSESIFAVTDSIPFKTIGEASQTISTTGTIVNRVTVKIYGMGQSVMTTTCRSTPADDGSNLWVTVETTQAVGATLPFISGVVFPTESLLGENAKVLMRVTYLDEDLRIVRNVADDQVFVYSRAA